MKNFFNWLKYRIKFYAPTYLWDILSKRAELIMRRKYSQKFKCYGNKNPDLTFFVIRKKPPGAGFFANFFYVVRGLIYAEKHGYIPVVDMENYWMEEVNEIRKINETKNAWCYFFNQVSKFSLAEVYQSKNVILSDGFEILDTDHYLRNKSTEIFMSRDKLKQVGRVIDQYIAINFTTKQYLENKKINLNWDPRKTLGIFVRGGAYNEHSEAKAWVNHPKFSDILQQAFEILHNKKIKKIFICTEDFRIYQDLKTELKNFEIIPSLRYSKNLTIESWLSSQKLRTKGGDNGINLGYEKTLAYLSEIILLSECESLIVTPNNPSVYALATCNLDTGDHRVVMNSSISRLNPN